MKWQTKKLTQRMEVRIWANSMIRRSLIRRMTNDASLALHNMHRSRIWGPVHGWGHHANTPKPHNAGAMAILLWCSARCNLHYCCWDMVMTQDERDDLNRKIALSIQPIPEQRAGIYLVCGIWRSREIGQSNTFEWVCPHYCTDPECTLMLMEKGKIAARPVHPKSAFAAMGYSWFGESLDHQHIMASHTVGEAVALVYASMIVYERLDLVHTHVYGTWLLDVRP